MSHSNSVSTSSYGLRPGHLGILGHVVLASTIGWLLAADTAWDASATYDEITYLEVAAHWWRTGDQESISRMGSPVLFWKIPHVPVFLALEVGGLGSWIDDPVGHQDRLLPWVRMTTALFGVGIVGLSALWASQLLGGRAAIAAAWLVALEPNLRAHVGLATMEGPLTFFWTLAVVSFGQYLATRRHLWFVTASISTGLAFSCKFTAVLLPALLGLAYVIAEVRRRPDPRSWPDLVRVAIVHGLFALMLVVATNLIVNGFATLPASPRAGQSHPALERALPNWAVGPVGALIDRPWPQDWVGFARQMQLQSGGGSSYLFGRRSESGFFGYYLVALAVKLPIALLVLLGLRWGSGAARLVPTAQTRNGAMLLAVCSLGLLAIVTLASSRNYGIRYLLPIWPPMLVWVAALAESPTRWVRGGLVLGIVGLGIATASTQPHPLSFFNGLVGGPEGGKHVLSDSNLDWGQGAKHLASWQRNAPENADLTLFYFGNTDPRCYGVTGAVYMIDAVHVRDDLPDDPTEVPTRFVAIGRSLQWGPWGPEGYFDSFDDRDPIHVTPDAAIAVYDLRSGTTSDVAMR